MYKLLFVIIIFASGILISFSTTSFASGWSNNWGGFTWFVDQVQLHYNGGGAGGFSVPQAVKVNKVCVVPGSWWENENWAQTYNDGTTVIFEGPTVLGLKWTEFYAGTPSQPASFSYVLYCGEALQDKGDYVWDGTSFSEAEFTWDTARLDADNMPPAPNAVPEPATLLGVGLPALVLVLTRFKGFYK